MLCDKTKQCTEDTLTPHEKNDHSSFRTPTVVGGRRPLPSKICAQSDSSLLNTLTSTYFRFNNVSTIKDSEKHSIMTNTKSTTCFPTNYICSAYVAPKSPKGHSKSGFLFFNQIQFQSKKVSYKVSLCEIFRRQCVL